MWPQAEFEGPSRSSAAHRAFVALALVPAASALRLPGTCLPSRRSGRPVAQVSPEGDAKDAASTAKDAAATDASAAALSRGRQALEQYRATAEAQTGATIPKPVSRWDERARAGVRKKLQPWLPNLAVLRRDLKPALKGFGFTQKEKARAYLQQRPPFPGAQTDLRPPHTCCLPCQAAEHRTRLSRTAPQRTVPASAHRIPSRTASYGYQAATMCIQAVTLCIPATVHRTPSPTASPAASLASCQVGKVAPPYVTVMHGARYARSAPTLAASHGPVGRPRAAVQSFAGGVGVVATLVFPAQAS